MNFYRCNECGKIVAEVKESGAPLICCGQKMQKLIAGEKDAAKEKHIPVVKIDGNTVNVIVGEVTHPMTAEHLIEWIAVVTEQGVQIKYLKAEQAPQAEFALTVADKVKEVYAYCNLHGLWKAAL